MGTRCHIPKSLRPRHVSDGVQFFDNASRGLAEFHRASVPEGRRQSVSTQLPDGLSLRGFAPLSAAVSVSGRATQPLRFESDG